MSQSGFYSMGLCGYEVWITNEDVTDEKIHWCFIGTQKEQIAHRTKICYNARGGAYFRTPHGRIYLTDCIRTQTV